jgi:hypothetical protein
MPCGWLQRLVAAQQARQTFAPHRLSARSEVCPAFTGPHKRTLAVLTPRSTTKAMAAKATGISAIARSFAAGRPVAHWAQDVDRHQAFQGCRPVARSLQPTPRPSGPAPDADQGRLRSWRCGCRSRKPGGLTLSKHRCNRPGRRDGRGVGRSGSVPLARPWPMAGSAPLKRFSQTWPARPRERKTACSPAPEACPSGRRGWPWCRRRRRQASGRLAPDTAGSPRPRTLACAAAALSTTCARGLIKTVVAPSLLRESTAA